MSSSFFFRCINPECGREYDALESIYECTGCHDPLDLVYSFPDFDPRIPSQRFGAPLSIPSTFATLYGLIGDR